MTESRRPRYGPGMISRRGFLARTLATSVCAIMARCYPVTLPPSLEVPSTGKEIHEPINYSNEFTKAWNDTDMGYDGKKMVPLSASEEDPYLALLRGQSKMPAKHMDRDLSSILKPGS